jgi:hypothetical protein
MRWRNGKFLAFGFVAICVGYVAFLMAEGVFSTEWAVVIAGCYRPGGQESE